MMKVVVPDIVKDLNLVDTIYAAVSNIVAQKDDGTRLYQVRWLDQTAQHDSWLKVGDFNDLCPIQNYEKNLSNKAGLKTLMKDSCDDQGRLKKSDSFEDTLEASKKCPKWIKIKSRSLKESN
jgi:hypothetical protein